MLEAMHIYFSGIGGAGIGPLALVAKEAGFEVSGSDKQHSSYIEYLKSHGVTGVHIGQTRELIEAAHHNHPIDWFVYSSALPRENPNHPELKFVAEAGIKHSKRDEFLNHLLETQHLKLIAIAGTQGKTTTTAMAIWLLKQLEVPVSYNVGAKLSFGDMGEFVPGSEYFVYECDEYDRNFLSFKPYLSLISGMDWDHPDIYPTLEQYNEAFRQFLAQSEKAILWQDDVERLQLTNAATITVLSKVDGAAETIKLAGEVNRQNAVLVAKGVSQLTGRPMDELVKLMSNFPGLSRRFEAIVPGLYADYAHTPGKIRGALQTAHELAGENVIVVYEGLHNTRQHFIKDDLAHLFDSVKKLYIVPSYRAREDESLEDLTPDKLVQLTSQPEKAEAANLNDDLKIKITEHLTRQDLVLCLSAGGGGSLDEWLRTNFGINNR